MDWQAINEVLGGEWGEAVVRLLRIIGILVGAWLLAAVLGRVISRLRARLDARLALPEQVKRAGTLSRVFRYAVSVVVTLVAAVLVLSELGISVAPILGAAGVVGIAVGFGAQNLVKDYFSGLFLLIENQLATGDVVTIAGLSGSVEDITLRHVRLRDHAGHVHYVSNGLITTVTNRTQGFAFAVVDVTVAYRQDIGPVVDLLRQVGAQLAADAHFAPRILEGIEMPVVESFTDAAVVLRCRIKTRGPDQWGVRREFLRRVRDAFIAQGIEMPMQQVTVFAGLDEAGNAPAVRLLNANSAGES